MRDGTSLGSSSSRNVRVGEQPADRREVEVEHALEAELTADALIGDGRVDVAVADDGCAALERRPDHLVDELRASGHVQESFRPRADVPSVQDEVAHPLPELGAARLPRGDDVDAVTLETRAQELRLRRLPGAVEAFEGDEHPPHPTVVSASARPGRDRLEEPCVDRL